MPQDALIGRKLDVMKLLWERGPVTIGEVHRELEGSRYPAVRALVHSLEARGYVRVEMNGETCRYSPAVTRRELGRRAVRRILCHYFDGSVSAFLEAVAELAGSPSRIGGGRLDQLNDLS